MSRLTQFRDYCRAMAGAGTTEAALWTQLADEIDEYEGQHGGLAPDLFGGLTAEPEQVEQ